MKQELQKTYILFHFQQFLHIIYSISPLQYPPTVCPLFIFAFVQDFVCLRVCGGTLVLYRSMSPLHQLSLVDTICGAAQFKTNFYILLNFQFIS